MHSEGDGVEEVHNAEEDDEAPALQGGVEGGGDHGGGGRNANDQPGLELTEPGAGAFDDIAHDGVIQPVKHPGCHHDDGDGAKLGSRQLPGEQNVGQKEVGKQRVAHVPAHGAQREHP